MDPTYINTSLRLFNIFFLIRDPLLTKVFPEIPCANTLLSVHINYFLGKEASWAKPSGIAKFRTCSGEVDRERLDTVSYPRGEPKHVVLIFMYYSSTYMCMVANFQK